MNFLPALSPAGLESHLWVPLEAWSWAWQLVLSPAPHPSDPLTPPCSGCGVNCQALPSDPSVGFSLVLSLRPLGVQRGLGVGGGGLGVR